MNWTGYWQSALGKVTYLLLGTCVCLGVPSNPDALAASPPAKVPAKPAAKTGEMVKTVKKTVETETHKAQEAMRKLASPAMKKEQNPQVSQWANDAVKKIEAAQSSINNNQLPEAKRQLTEAQTLLDQIQQSEPTGKAINRVETTRKQLEAGQINTDQDLAPLEQEIVEFETVAPVPKAKQHLKMAKQSLQEKNKANAHVHLADVESQLIYAEANLPVSRTKQEVLGAQTLLEQGKAKEAHKLLTDSLQHIQSLATETNKATPLKEPSAVPAP
jgi:NADH dehydrogenase/NADH:ubiquinone oxidoreductase subunit G